MSHPPPSVLRAMSSLEQDVAAMRDWTRSLGKDAALALLRQCEAREEAARATGDAYGAAIARLARTALLMNILNWADEIQGGANP